MVASPDGADESVLIHADASVYAGLLDGEEGVTLSLNPERKAYVHLIRGSLSVNGHVLQTGDAALIDKEADLNLSDPKDAEVLVFDLAG